MVTPSTEDYLKAIYEIREEHGDDLVTTSQLSDKLGISRASVTGMLKKLAASQPRLITYQRYQGASLTPAGEQVALKVIRHHRLLEAYLNQVLGFSWDQVHCEADRLEHVISDEFEERIASFLGDPGTDPHGSPIPRRDGTIAIIEEKRLTENDAGDQATITRVSDDDPAFLRYIDGLGLRPGAEIEITARGPFDGPLFVKNLTSGKIHSLNQGVTDHIFTRLKESPSKTQRKE